MLTVPAAQACVLEVARPLAPERLPLGVPVLGMVLAEDVAADLDSPPYDKALMDGYALRCADLAGGQATLRVIEEITAGHLPTRELGPGEAARIMTGAAIPAGADAVVMVERTQETGDGRVRIEDARLRPEANILRRGREMRRGEIILPAGTVIRPVELGILAGLGRTASLLYPRPRVAILSTGDEIVDAEATPGPGQIRNTNGPLLCGQVARAGGEPLFLGIAPDNQADLRALVAAGLRQEVLVLSGGVSAGKLDLVPGVLRDLGVFAHFHKIEMKPGKPLLFGSLESEGRQRLVFGLPGNPVSSLVCFELFVRPALRRLAGHADPGPRQTLARLRADFPYRTDRPTWHPAKVVLEDAALTVEPVPWLGSADLRALARADALLVLPVGDQVYQAGQTLSVVLMDE